jgi:fatty-acyl-CoA synthase
MMPISCATVGDFLDEVASRYPENEALVDFSRGVRFTYGDLVRVVNQLAKGLLALGLNKGDHVALWSPNRWEWILSQFALAKIGAVLVSVDTNYQLQQLEYLLRQSDSRALIMTEGQKGSEYLEMIGQLCPELVHSLSRPLRCSALPELRNIILIGERAPSGMLPWKDVLETGKELTDPSLSHRQQSCREDEGITLLYTSGTTGAPKGVMSSHFGIIRTTLASAENQGLTEKDRLCLSVPLSHMFGCICITLAAFMKGATLVIPSSFSDPSSLLEAVEREHCTALYGSPSSFIAVMNHPHFEFYREKSLRTGIMGGAQCPMEVMNKVVEEMGVREIVIGYGQTESSSWITQTRRDDPLDLRVSTVGKALPGVQVKIIDPVSGQEVLRGAIGEICARGFNMKGYYKMPAATANALDAEGWLHTGDLGSMDPEGYVRTAGRLKETINKGGEIIYPTEVEEILFNHSKILNVQVFGVPDKKLGEEVAAWIQLGEGVIATEDEITRYCREKLPPAQLPRYVKFVKGFPMTPLGKIQKFKMREMAIKEYGLE